MQDQLLGGGGLELAHPVLKVGPGRLRPGSDGIGMEFVVVSGGAGFEEVRAVSVDSGHQKPNPVGSLGSLLSFNLGF